MVEPNSRIYEIFKQIVLNSRTFTNLLDKFVKEWIDNTVAAWGRNAKEGTHLKKKKTQLVPLLSLQHESLGEHLQDLALQQLERVHSRKEKAKT